MGRIRGVEGENKIPSLSVYFIKLSTTNYCTHTSISITPHLPLKVVMGLIIIFVILYIGWVEQGA